MVLDGFELGIPWKSERSHCHQQVYALQLNLQSPPFFVEWLQQHSGVGFLEGLALTSNLKLI